MEVTPWAKICFNAIFLNTIATYSPAYFFYHTISCIQYSAYYLCQQKVDWQLHWQ